MKNPGFADEDLSSLEKRLGRGSDYSQRHPVKLYQTALPRMVQLETGQAARSVLRRI